MSVKPVTCHIAECDDCGKQDEHDYIMHWPSAQEAIDGAESMSDWWSNGKVLLCDRCRYKPHAHVPDQFSPDDCNRCDNPAEEHESVKEPTR